MNIEHHSRIPRTDLPSTGHLFDHSPQGHPQLQLRRSTSSHSASPWSPQDPSSHPAGQSASPSEHPHTAQRDDDQIPLGNRPSTAGLSVTLSSLSVESSLPSPLGIFPPEQDHPDVGSIRPGLQPIPHQFAYQPPFLSSTSPDWASSTRSNSSSELYYGAPDPATISGSQDDRIGAFNLAAPQGDVSNTNGTPLEAPLSRRASRSLSNSQPHEPCRDLHHQLSYSGLVQPATTHFHSVDSDPKSSRPDPPHHIESTVEGSVLHRTLTGNESPAQAAAGNPGGLMCDSFITPPEHKVEQKSPKIGCLHVPNPELSKPAIITRGQTSNFVSKLYLMINDPQSACYIQWTPLGISFVVSNVGEFSNEILGSHFKHSNFSSFVRQLNMYGFHKSNRTPRAQRTNQNPNDQVWEFSHQYFLRGREDLLEKIRRKAADNGEPTVRPKIDLPTEVAYQLRRLGEENSRLAQTLQAERAKVDKLANVVKSLYGAFRNAFPDEREHPLPPFPDEIVESPEGSNEVLGEASPSNSADSVNGPGTSPACGVWNEPGSASAQSTSLFTISPASSPTLGDFSSQGNPSQRPQSSIRSNRRQSFPKVSIPALPRINSTALQSATTVSSPVAGDEGYDTYGSTSSSHPSFDNEGRVSGPKRQRKNPITIKTTGLSSPGLSPLSATAQSFPSSLTTSTSTVRGTVLPSSTPSSAVQLHSHDGSFSNDLPPLHVPMPLNSYGNNSPHNTSQHSNRFPPVRRLTRARSDSAPHGMGLVDAWQQNQDLRIGGGDITTSPSPTSPVFPVLSYASPTITSKHVNDPWIPRPPSTSHYPAHPQTQRSSMRGPSCIPSAGQFCTDVDNGRRDSDAHAASTRAVAAQLVMPVSNGPPPTPSGTASTPLNIRPAKGLSENSRDI